MREYRRLCSGVAVLLAAYFVGGLLTLALPQREVFPVYSWFLFSLVPQSGSQYGLLLKEVDGQELAPPVLYQDAEGWIETPHSVTVFKLVQQLGAALEHDGPDAQRFRELLENEWLLPQTRYEIVTINVDPIARWKTGEYAITRRGKTFTSPEAKR
jgi:hypothetical protein